MSKEIRSGNYLCRPDQFCDMFQAVTIWFHLSQILDEILNIRRSRLSGYNGNPIGEPSQYNFEGVLSHCNIDTKSHFGVAGTGWSGLDMMFSGVQPGDKVVMFVNGTFSGIDALSARMKAATAAEMAENSLNPEAASVVTINVPHGQSVSRQIIDKALSEHKPKWAAMAHWETGSGRINDLEGFSAACEKYDVLGLVDAVSSLGVSNFKFIFL